GRSDHLDHQEGMGVDEVVFLDHAVSTDVAALVITAQGMVRLRGGGKQAERQDRSGPVPHVSSPPSSSDQGGAAFTRWRVANRAVTNADPDARQHSFALLSCRPFMDR